MGLFFSYVLSYACLKNKRWAHLCSGSILGLYFGGVWFQSVWVFSVPQGKCWDIALITVNIKVMQLLAMYTYEM
jgi:hypothetical protein